MLYRLRYEHYSCYCYVCTLFCAVRSIVIEARLFMPDSTSSIFPQRLTHFHLQDRFQPQNCILMPSCLSPKPVVINLSNDSVTEIPMLIPNDTSENLFNFSNYFSPLIAVVVPSAIPSVLSGTNKIFTVASIILRSSMMLGCAIYIRSICSLS